MKLFFSYVFLVVSMVLAGGVTASTTYPGTQNCSLDEKQIQFSVEHCVDGESGEHCTDNMIHRELLIGYNQISLSSEGLTVSIIPNAPPRDIMREADNRRFIKLLSTVYPADKYKEYVVSASRQDNVVRVDTNITKELFGRWTSSTRTAFEITFDQYCTTCTLTHYLAVTDKVGFNLNEQKAGRSVCVIQ